MSILNVAKVLNGWVKVCNNNPCETKVQVSDSQHFNFREELK